MIDRKKEILSQYFINAKELKELIPSLGINRCREIIKLARQKMLEDNCYMTKTKPLEALTDYVLKMLGVRI